MNNETLKARIVANATSISRSTGYATARIIFRNNPGWTVEQASEYASNSHPKFPIKADIFRLSFVEMFTRLKEQQLLSLLNKNFGNSEMGSMLQTGNMLPGKESTMSFDNNLNKNTTSFVNKLNEKYSDTSWIKPATLAEFNMVFSILRLEHVPSSQSSAGFQWNMEIAVRQDTIDQNVEFGIDFTKKVKTSLASGNRDAMFKELSRFLPQHNCYFEQVPMNGGNFFYKLCQLEEGDSNYQPPIIQKLPATSKIARPVIKSGGVDFASRLKTPSVLNKPSNTPDDFDPFLDSAPEE